MLQDEQHVGNEETDLKAETDLETEKKIVVLAEYFEQQTNWSQ